MHLVHGNETGGLSVLGVLIEEGEFNQELAPIFDTIEDELEANGKLPDTVEFLEKIAIAELLPDNVVDRVFSLEQITEAFAYLERGLHFGKVVITL